MTVSTVSDPTSAGYIHEAVHHAAHLLPAQGPITVFIHHNTLHALEHLSFEEAVCQAAELFGGQPYLSEQRYRNELQSGRISPKDIDQVLFDELGEQADLFVGLLGTRYSLRRAILGHPLSAVQPNQLEWVIAESQAFDRFSSEANQAESQRMVASTKRWVTNVLTSHNSNSTAQRQFDELCQLLPPNLNARSSGNWSEHKWSSFTLQMLWQICLREVAKYPHNKKIQHPIRHRDYLYWQTGCDADSLVNDFLVRFCVAMLDQGMSRWQLPGRSQGIWSAFAELYGTAQWMAQGWLRPLAKELQRIQSANMSATDSIRESLELLGVSPDETESYITQTLLSLRGFGGMIWQMEIRGDRIAHGLPAGSLVELTAVRLLLDRLALQHIVLHELHRPIALEEIRNLPYRPDNDDPWENARCEAFAIFQLAQALGWHPETLVNLSPVNWHKLLEEIRSFDEYERRKILHLAYERRYRQNCFDAIQTHCRDARFKQLRVPEHDVDPPRFDLIACIDEREESFRRHLEEIEPRSRTWGAAGFFGVAMYYCAADSFQFVPLCPIVVEPQHYVQEVVTLDQIDAAQRRTTLRRIVGKTQRGLHSSSRSLFSGAFTAFFGLLTTVPLVARVLFPRLAGLFRDRLATFHSVPSQTALHLERSGPKPGKEESEIGFSINEMAGIVERSLRVLGLTSNWSRLIVVMGHGSTNMNNPHASAYDCGACGGGRGGPNARAFAQMGNDPRVRAKMAENGFVIPDSTLFLPCFHNTCNDSVTYFDLANVPSSHVADVQHAQKVLDETSARNAHERCRRFESADLNLSPLGAFKHVMGRSEDLSQVRPECGHATNAMCIVGRREFSRGLYLDRRSFLHSYDPTQDDADHSILAAILSAVFPVCGGINLEYFFSYVDPECYGCGTKLPHNIAALVGVMNGAASDLRPGLPWQMVEIHEPIRLLILIESTPEAMLSIMARNEIINRMVRGYWVQLATFDSQTGMIQWYHQGEFVPHQPDNQQLPTASSSTHWYQGQRQHLGFAQILPTNSPVGVKS